ncbi:hypothetical protein BGZ99_001230 [Dissophora globulifera]|uniref:ER-bound oxygenase mpaB/mpaB'/Rubber oxygenase catalytic domain-containing protein n=1 Tax=Dissophora globulifera TaxID=979702 RepID=A0A9P6RY00_9FUNG|nr:hypothetical protein BGZ99_001230 [Dissophora globulifera]
MYTFATILSSYPILKYVALLLAYMGLVRHLRFKRINNLLRKYPDPTLPLRDYKVAREVAANVATYEFPSLYVVGLDVGIVPTNAIPSISKVLVSTKQIPTNCLRRIDDSSLLLREVNEVHSRNERRTMIEGRTDVNEMANDERRKEIAIERIKFIHGHYNIKQDDYLYTLYHYINGPLAFIDKFDWRSTTELEKNAMMAIWTHNGKALGIEDIPETLPELKAWAEEYSNQNTKYHPANTIATDPLVNLLIGGLPEFLHQFCRKIFSGFMSPQIREAIKLETPHAGLTLVFETLLKARGAFVKYFMLPRRLPKVRTALRINQDMKYVPAFHEYGVVRPDGYRIEDIGPDNESFPYMTDTNTIISVALETPTKKCIDFTLTEVSRPYETCNLEVHGISDLPGYIFRECGLRPAQRFAEEIAK